MDPVLTARNLGASFEGEWVFRSWDVSIARGERIALLGRSGCGKTTFLRIAAGLAVPSEGEIRVRASRVGYVFQEPRLIPWLSVRRNLAFVSDRDPSAILAGLNLSDAADARPHELSGGMKQRVNLARALLTEPDVLLLDEAFSSLDVALKLRLFSDLEGLWRRNPFASVTVTHDPRDALLTSDRILLIGGAPARILRDIPAPLSAERSYGDPGVVALEAAILRELSDVSPARQS
jgi:NitT/TauT family transport system ATP-binding protein